MTSPTTVSAHALSDVGRRRDQNEDHVLVDPALGLYLVADGMGGQAAGEIASAEAARCVRDAIARDAGIFAHLGEDPSSPERRAAAQGAIERAVLEACKSVFRMARAERSKRGMGTTLDCVVVRGRVAVTAHVGDSRVYLLRQGRANRLTEDHSLVAMQVKAGIISKEEAAVSEYRNVLTNAVGVMESAHVDTLFLECVPGDQLLLCSDGLHGLVADEEIAQIAAKEKPENLPRKLVDLANERGGDDNVSVVVVDFPRAAPSVPDEATDAANMIDLLRRIPLFAPLSYKEQSAVISVAEAFKYAPGQVIVKEGTLADDLFIVVRGRVVVEKTGVKLMELGPGEHFGEMGLIDDAPRSASVRALEPSRVLMINRAPIMALMRKEPRLAVKLLWSFIQTMSDRLRAASTEIVVARQELAQSRGDGPFITLEE